MIFTVVLSISVLFLILLVSNPFDLSILLSLSSLVLSPIPFSISPRFPFLDENQIQTIKKPNPEYCKINIRIHRITQNLFPLMIAHNIHGSVTLRYTYPTEEPFVANKDAQLARCLRINDDPLPLEPIMLTKPISKTFSTSKNADPLKGLIEENQAILKTMTMTLPYSEDRAKKTTSKTTTEKVAGRKRPSEDPQDVEDMAKEEHSFFDESSIYNTPIPNKTIYFSPAGSVKKPLQLTPVSFLKETITKPNKKLATKIETEAIGERETLTKNTDEADETDFDPLACHANNIMRMAVDSTMMGSSFSLSFLSTFANDSDCNPKRKLDDDCDRSLIEGLKHKWSMRSLVKLKAKKVEINADDLQAAVSES